MRFLQIIKKDNDSFTNNGYLYMKTVQKIDISKIINKKI